MKKKEYIPKWQKLAFQKMLDKIEYAEFAAKLKNDWKQAQYKAIMEIEGVRFL